VRTKLAIKVLGLGMVVGAVFAFGGAPLKFI
jgi:hypothetical protein